jgi:hypothetical protein
MKKMRKWTGDFAIASLPDKIEGQLTRRSENVLKRHNVPTTTVERIAGELIHEVSFAYAARSYTLKGGRGPRPDAPSNVLSVNIADLLASHGLRGNWLNAGDDEEDGQMGMVAELEAIAQSAFRTARGDETGTMVRPARISNARKTLGKVHRN